MLVKITIASQKWLTSKLVLGEAINEVRCLIQYLILNVHSYLDLFLYVSSSSFDNHWRYQQRYHEVLGRKSPSFIRCIKACVNLNGKEWLVEMNWQNFEKNGKSFGIVLKIWQKIYLWDSSIFRNVLKFILELICMVFPLPRSFPEANLSSLKVNHLPLLDRTTSKTLSSSRHISNSLRVCQ